MGSLDIPPTRSKTALALVLISMFGGGALTGLGLAWWLTPDSAATQFFGFLYLPLIMGLGYKIWHAQIVAKLMGGIMKKGIGVLWQMISKKQKPEIKDVLPNQTQAGELLAYAYKKASIFTTLGIFISFPVALIAGFIAPQGNFLLAFITFLVVGTGYGITLTRFARNGYLMLPE